MTRTLCKLLVVLVCVLTLPACGGRTSPTGPTGVDRPFDPNKPITDNNRPPGPGPSVRAVFDYAVYGYDCSAEPESCDEKQKLSPAVEQIDGRETYVVKLGFSHTVVLCVVHPGVPAVRLAPGYARQILLFASAGVGAADGRDLFYEGDEVNRGTHVSEGWYRKCVVSVSKPVNFDSKFGQVQYLETGGDIIHPEEETRVNVMLAFRVILAR